MCPCFQTRPTGDPGAEYMVGLRNLGKDSGNGGELKRVASMGAQGNWKRQDLALAETFRVLFFVYVCVLTYT